MENTENYIEITRVQKVQIPINDDFTLSDFCQVINENELFDDDRIDWDNEEVIEEDYSYAVHESKFQKNGRSYEFNSPYDIGTTYNDITTRSFIQ